jgi:2-dehydro-3-deoxyphosphogluconate aldolase/(4S)-4-hydroxy-2-oxoglutarate aldolase
MALLLKQGLHEVIYGLHQIPALVKKPVHQLSNMAQFSRLKVYNYLHEYPIVPLLSSNNANDAVKILDACYEGGIRAFEFTNRGEPAHEIFSALVKHARAKYTDLALGIGTILDAGTASLYIQSGADFIICPNLVEEVGKVCNRRKIAWIPGVATPTEISKAEEMGAEIVKLFPGQTLGPEFVRALKAPMPHTSVMATGGVSPEEANLREWFEAGVTCVGIGGKLFPKTMLQSGDFSPLSLTLSRLLQFANSIKK